MRARDHVEYAGDDLQTGPLTLANQEGAGFSIRNFRCKEFQGAQHRRRIRRAAGRGTADTGKQAMAGRLSIASR